MRVDSQAVDDKVRRHLGAVQVPVFPRTRDPAVVVAMEVRQKVLWLDLCLGVWGMAEAEGVNVDVPKDGHPVRRKFCGPFS